MEEYREKIIELINQIENLDILNYIYIIVADILKEEANKCEDSI